MTTRPLCYLSQSRLDELIENVPANLDRYVSGDFAELERQNGWAIESSAAKVDLEILASLDGELEGAESDRVNSPLVYKALPGLTPALAREERVWARLTHVECLSFSRQRWLRGTPAAKLEAQVRTHFFASGRTGPRDDNAVGRLWWNMHIATMANAQDPVSALAEIVKSADIRSNIVERTRTGARRPLLSGIVEILRRDPALASEARFRSFMKVMNRRGGGRLFEALDEAKTRAFLEECASAVG